MMEECVFSRDSYELIPLRDETKVCDGVRVTLGVSVLHRKGCDENSMHRMQRNITS